MINRPTHSRGSVYVFVMATTMLVTIIGMMVLSTTQIATRTNGGTNDSVETAVLAESAVEYGLARIASNPNWRTTYTNSVVVSPTVPLGRGNITFKLVDDATPPAATLTNPADPVRIYGIANIGNTKRIYSVRASAGYPVSSMQYAAAANAIDLGTASVGGAPAIFSSTTIAGVLPTFSGATLNAGKTVTIPTVLNATVNNNVVASEFPDPVHVFDYYIQNGTTLITSSTTIQNAVLGFGVNTIGGSTNAKGIYILDCKGQTVTIKNVRVAGTLVILNPGAGSGMTGAVNFSPYVSGYPCLMVNGNWSIAVSGTLSESALSTNFNPFGAPYMTSTDTTMTTTYPCRFDGIVYVAGNLTTSGTFSTLGNVIVSGSWTAGGTANLAYDPTSYKAPPPGFTSPRIIPMTGTWRWESQ